MSRHKLNTILPSLLITALALSSCMDNIGSGGNIQSPVIQCAYYPTVEYLTRIEEDKINSTSATTFYHRICDLYQNDLSIFVYHCTTSNNGQAISIGYGSQQDFVKEKLTLGNITRLFMYKFTDSLSIPTDRTLFRYFNNRILSFIQELNTSEEINYQVETQENIARIQTIAVSSSLCPSSSEIGRITYNYSREQTITIQNDFPMTACTSTNQELINQNISQTYDTNNNLIQQIIQTSTSSTIEDINILSTNQECIINEN